MVTSKHEAAVQGLASMDVAERKRAVRFIKNAIIGNKTKKEMYLTFGIAPRLVEYLSGLTFDVDLKIQAAVVLGSFAYGDEESITNLVQAECLGPLLSCIAPGNDTRLIEASARVLRALYQSHNTPRHDIINNPNNIRTLITLLSPDSMSSSISLKISEVIASIIARVVESKEEQEIFAEANVIPSLVGLLDDKWCFYPKIREAALDALAALCKENEKISNMVAKSKTLNGEDTLSIILRLSKDKRATMKILAATCMVNLIKSKANIPAIVEIIPSILYTLIKLFSDTSNLTALSMSVQEKAPLVFAYLIMDRGDLQKAAMDGDAISKLSRIVSDCIAEQNSYLTSNDPLLSIADQAANLGFKKEESFVSENDRKIAINSSTFHNERVLENCFIALSAVCSLNEECRKMVIDAKIMPQLITCLSHANKNIRAAACNCAKSLSRSIKNLRTNLIESGISIPLFHLLSDPSIVVQTAASAAICNIVLDFSPMKKSIIENGGVEKLVSLILKSDSSMMVDGQQDYLNLKLNCLWALKNLLYQADSDIKNRVMVALHWDNLERLFNDPDLRIQEQALNIVRNIACVKEDDIEQPFKYLGAEKLIRILEKKLLEGSNEHIILQILYIIVNISSGNQKHKAAIMESEIILNQIKLHLNHRSPKIKISAIWCIINLTWTDDNGCESRLKQLSLLEIPDILKTLLSTESDLDVKERVCTALLHFGIKNTNTTVMEDLSFSDDMVIDNATSNSRFGIIFGNLLQATNNLSDLVNRDEEEDEGEDDDDDDQ